MLVYVYPLTSACVCVYVCVWGGEETEEGRIWGHCMQLEKFYWDQHYFPSLLFSQIHAPNKRVLARYCSTTVWLSRNISCNYAKESTRIFNMEKCQPQNSTSQMTTTPLGNHLTTKSNSPSLLPPQSHISKGCSLKLGQRDPHQQPRGTMAT